MKNSEKLLHFLRLTNQFKSVTRCQFVPGEPTRRYENDAEHSYELAMCAWYLNHEFKLGYSDEKLLKLALSHDLVEVYTGDVDSYTLSKEGSVEKSSKEELAVDAFKQDLDFEDLHDSIKNYETKDSEEAVFIWTLDKVIGNLNSHLDGKTLKDCGYTKEQHDAVLNQKISKHEFVASLYREYLAEWNLNPEYYAKEQAFPEYKKQRPPISRLWTGSRSN